MKLTAAYTSFLSGLVGLVAHSTGSGVAADGALRAVASRASSHAKTDDGEKLLLSADLAANPASLEAKEGSKGVALVDGQNMNEGQDGRRLSSCWNDSKAVAVKAKWHPQYSYGWSKGHCRETVDCNSPGYGSELACCKSAYAGQVSGYCLSRLPNPPTTSPTASGGLGVYYPDYETAWSDAYCINRGPVPSGRPVYDTMLDCCKNAYGGQVSGKCLAMLPSPPTTSPTNSAMTVDFWYARYEEPWSHSGCSNKLPIPFNIGDRPTYETHLGCCKGAYGGQMSGVCLSELENPPTTSPTGAGGADFYYPDYDTSWDRATCLNKLPLPYGHGGRPEYSTYMACCRGAYGNQQSFACICSEHNPNPPDYCDEAEGGSSSTGGSSPDPPTPCTGYVDTIWGDNACVNGIQPFSTNINGGGECLDSQGNKYKWLEANGNYADEAQANVQGCLDYCKIVPMFDQHGVGIELSLSRGGDISACECLFDAAADTSTLTAFGFVGTSTSLTGTGVIASSDDLFAEQNLCFKKV